MIELKDLQSEKLRGNFFLTYGKEGAGKTTTQLFFLRYLIEGGLFDVEPRAWAANDNGAHFLKDDWMELSRQGFFPDPTKVRELRAFRFRAQPIKEFRDFPPLDFTFFEIAGEDYRSIVRSPDSPESKFPPGLGAFIANPRINFINIFVCDGENLDEDDKFFRDYINLIDETLRRRAPEFWARSPVLLVISKPDHARTTFESAASAVELTSTVPLERQIMRKYLPQTQAALERRGCEMMPTFLRLGELADDPTAPGGRRIVKPDFRDIENVMMWIYEKFTGRVLERNSSIIGEFLRRMGLG